LKLGLGKGAEKGAGITDKVSTKRRTLKKRQVQGGGGRYEGKKPPSRGVGRIVRDKKRKSDGPRTEHAASEEKRVAGGLSRKHKSTKDFLWFTSGKQEKGG